MKFKYRIWHLLAAMTFVALWVPLSKWLLALEALDHPQKPQTVYDFVGFYLGSLSLVGLLVWVAVFMKKRTARFATSSQSSPGGSGADGELS